MTLRAVPGCGSMIEEKTKRWIPLRPEKGQVITLNHTGEPRLYRIKDVVPLPGSDGYTLDLELFTPDEDVEC